VNSDNAVAYEETERMVAARMARRVIFERSPAPTLSFVQEEVTLRRPVGGRMVWRRQLERLLEMGQLRNVSIQVMPTDCEEHFGTGGLIEVLKFHDGTAVGRSEGAFNGRPVSDPKQVIPEGAGLVKGSGRAFFFGFRVLEGTRG
jgi:hypothetical protein